MMAEVGANSAQIRVWTLGLGHSRIIVPKAMHTHVARRARLEAAREADFDEHRADVRGFGFDGCDGRDNAYCA